MQLSLSSVTSDWYFLPGSQSTNILEHHLLIRVVNQLDGIGRAFTGAGAAALAQSWVNKRSTTQTANTHATLF